MANGSHPRKVGLKYCGGCRARYDRVEEVNRIRERLGGAIEFTGADDGEAQEVLVVTGCPSACASPVSGGTRTIRYATSPEDVEQWIREMLDRSL